ncbi:MAG TPA: 3-methyladenine DNA glycosylase 2 [Morganella sp. (in: Bacteria)]|nr:3-methyladenine DNA glycosylase 2 [Morganella sp. (in: enterobacteria)]
MSKNNKLIITVLLPSHYHTADFLAFHLRDTHNVAEQVTENRVMKGICLHGHPALLTLETDAGQVRVTLHTDGPTLPGDEAALHHLACHMLGLLQPVQEFESLYQEHPQVGQLIRRQQGLRIYQSATPFEAINWAIIGQQISVHAAISIRRRLIQHINLRHSGGLWCYPDAAHILKTDFDGLRSCGFSVGKANALLTLSEQLESGELVLPDVVTPDNADAVSASLTAIKGIGTWTVSYALLRGFNYLNGSLHGDVAVRRNLQRLLEREEKLTADETQAWLAEFAPHRALMAAHLWRLESAAGY